MDSGELFGLRARRRRLLRQVQEGCQPRSRGPEPRFCARPLPLWQAPEGLLKPTANVAGEVAAQPVTSLIASLATPKRCTWRHSLAYRVEGQPNSLLGRLACWRQLGTKWMWPISTAKGLDTRNDLGGSLDAKEWIFNGLLGLKRRSCRGDR